MPLFEYDSEEAVLGDPFLTPVYFGKVVLIRYLYDPRFYCEFSSDTYGHVHGAGFAMAFGINQNGTVLAWLGDLENLPAKEQLHWFVENTSSEHDLASEFFDAQIGAEFTEPPAGIRALSSVARLNAAFLRQFGVHLYHERPLEMRIGDARRYRRLIINTRDDFKRFVSELNEIINESTDNAVVRHFLTTRQIAVPPGALGNKLLESVYTNVLADTDSLIAPFFFLYDLRLWADHAIPDARRDRVAALLNVTNADDGNELMSALLARIHASAVALIAKIEGAPGSP